MATNQPTTNTTTTVTMTHPRMSTRADTRLPSANQVPPNQDPRNPPGNSSAPDAANTPGPSGTGVSRAEVDAYMAACVSHALALQPLDLVLAVDGLGLNPRGAAEVLVDRLARYSAREKFGPFAAQWEDDVDWASGAPVTMVGHLRQPEADESIPNGEADLTSSPTPRPLGAANGPPPPAQRPAGRSFSTQDLANQGLADLDPLTRRAAGLSQGPPATSGPRPYIPPNIPDARREATQPPAPLSNPYIPVSTQIPARPPPVITYPHRFLQTGQSMGPFQDPLPMDDTLASNWDATMDTQTTQPPAMGPHVTFGPGVEGGEHTAPQPLTGSAQTPQRPTPLQRGVRRPSYNSTYRLDAAGPMDAPNPANLPPPFQATALGPRAPSQLYQTYQTPTQLTDSRMNPFTRNHKLIEALRRDDFVFSGKSEEDPYAFLERLEEAMCLYDLTEDEILRALPAAFRGHAATWFRTEKGFMLSLADFQAAFQETFCPAERNESLWQDIRRRTQGEKETMRDYLICMKGLFSHIHPLPPIEQQLNIIHSQLHPQYLKQIPRRYISSYAELLAAGKDIERMKENCNRYRPPPTPAESYSPAFACVTPTPHPRTKGATPAHVHASGVPLPQPQPMNSYSHIPRLMDTTVAPPPQWPTQTPVQPQWPTQTPAPRRNPPQNGPLTCYRCNQAGHMARECPMPRPRYQPAFPPRVPPNYQYSPVWNNQGYQEPPQNSPPTVPTTQSSQGQGNGNQGQR